MSSQGGTGKIGTLDDETESVKEDLEVLRNQQLSVAATEAQVADDSAPVDASITPSTALFATSHTSSPRRTASIMTNSTVPHQRLQGDERVQIAQEIKNRLDDRDEAEEEPVTSSLLPRPIRKVSAATSTSVTWESSAVKSSLGSNDSRGRSPSIVPSEQSDRSQTMILQRTRPAEDGSLSTSPHSQPMLSPTRSTFRRRQPSRQPSIFSTRSDGAFSRRDTIRSASHDETVTQNEALREEVLHELQMDNLSRAQEKEDEKTRAERNKRLLGWTKSLVYK